jgi:hypothetical protein
MMGAKIAARTTARNIDRPIQDVLFALKALNVALRK